MKLFQNQNPENVVVASGGGMSCTYSLGVLNMLQKIEGFKPDLLVGGSGSGPNVSYFATKQMGDVISIWFDYVSRPDVITKKELFPSEFSLKELQKNFRNFRKFYQRSRFKLEDLTDLLDLDYIIYCLKQIRPLDVVRLHTKSQIEVVLAAANYQTCETDYFSSKDPRFMEDPKRKLWFEAIRASAAIPLAYDKKVKLFDQQYVDGDFASPAEHNARLVAEMGAKNVIVIKNNNPLGMQKLLILGKVLEDKNLTEILKKRLQRKVGAFNLEREFPQTNFVRIAPSKSLPTSTLNNRLEDMLVAFKMGARDVLNHPKIRKLSGI